MLAGTTIRLSDRDSGYETAPLVLLVRRLDPLASTPPQPALNQDLSDLSKRTKPLAVIKTGQNRSNANALLLAQAPSGAHETTSKNGCTSENLGLDPNDLWTPEADSFQVQILYHVLPILLVS